MCRLGCITLLIVVCVTTSLTASPVHAAPYQPESVSLLLNGGFEEGYFSPAGSPDHWSRDVFNQSDELLWDDTQAFEGGRSVKIKAGAPTDAHWVQTVPIQPNTNYRVSGWIKTENVGHTVETVDMGATLSILGTWDEHSNALLGTNDWTYVSFAFNSRQRTEVTVAARLGFWSGTTTGTAWFDDLELAPIQASDPHPGWKILALIFDTVDFRFTDEAGVPHHYFTVMTPEEKDQAAQTVAAFVEQDIPALTSGNMIPTITVRYPESSLTRLTAFYSGWWPGPWDVSAELDPAFDSVIVIWDPWVLDDATGEITFIGGGAGLSPPLGTGQTYTAILVDAATMYGHRNVFKHEWGHNITSFYDAYGTAPKPAVNNHINSTDTLYVHCPTGETYILEDETPDNPIPNSIYNNESGFTHDYYSGTTATPDQPARCLGITPATWASGGPVSKPLRPSTPAQQIQSIKENVEQLVSAGDLKEGQAKPLFTKLDAADKALDAGRNDMAVKNLQAFVKKVKNLIKTGHLPEAGGLNLIDQANVLMDQLR